MNIIKIKNYIALTILLVLIALCGSGCAMGAGYSAAYIGVDNKRKGKKPLRTWQDVKDHWNHFAENIGK